MRPNAVATLALALSFPVASACKSAANAGTRGDSTRSSPSPQPPKPLSLVAALPIEFPGDFEPSGLLLLEGRILTVSDKDDGTVFELIPSEGRAKVAPFLRFAAPPAETPPFDFEGISLDASGALLLVSEAKSRVLSVSRSGETSWVTPPLAPLARAHGLLAKHNAGFEGITRLPNGDLLLAAEREGRGLVELRAGGDPDRAEVFPMPHSTYPAPKRRDPDFADLTVAAGDVYVLERYAHLIVRLERVANGWREREALSYASIENDPRLSYADTRYGLGEGLAIDGEHIYLVLDNNRDRRATDANDHRALLLVLRRR